MSGTRFARSGRCRLFTSLLALVLVFGMVAIFHSSQQQLDEIRDQHLRCEQQQESLNIRLQSIVEQKYNMEKSHEHERKEQLETNKNLEQKLKVQKELYLKKEMESNVRYEQLQHNLKHLQTEHNKLVDNCSKTRKQYIENTESLEKKLQSLENDLQKEKSTQDGDINQWKEKYNSMIREKQQFEIKANASASKLAQLQERIKQLEDIAPEHKSTNDYKLRIGPDSLQQLNKPLNKPETTRNTFPPHASFNKSKSLKYFNEQQLVSPDLYMNPIQISNNTLATFTAKETQAEQNLTRQINKIATNLLSSTMKTHFVGVGNKSLMNEQKAFLQDNPLFSLPFPAHNNHTLLIHSVENFQIIPKSIKSLSESENTQRKVRVDSQEKSASPLSSPLDQTVNLGTKLSNVSVEINSTTSTSSSSLAPLAPVPFQNFRKLPDNVAPIPENFDELLKNDPIDKLSNNKLENIADAGDIDAAVEDLQKNDINNENNNRYANVVSDLEQRGKMRAAANEDSGAHEIKDREFMNDQNFNLPVEEDNNNFFDGGGRRNEANVINKHKASNGDDVIGAGIGVGPEMGDDIAMRNHNALGAESVNNEVIRDQGKEFPDGINLEDVNDEDEDDDYSNPAARQQGEQAVRN